MRVLTDEQYEALIAVVEAARGHAGSYCKTNPLGCRMCDALAAYDATLPPAQPACDHDFPIRDYHCVGCGMNVSKSWADQERWNHLYGTMAGGPEVSDPWKARGGRE